MIKFKGLKNTEALEITPNSEKESTVKEEVVEEICLVEEKPVDFVEVDTFDDSLTLREFNHSLKRKREHSSCDADSAFVEDFSSDNLSTSGSDSNSNKTPMLHPPVSVEVAVPKSKDGESVSNNNIRDWFGPALETDSQDKFADIINWGSQPASDFEGDFADRDEHDESMGGIPLESLSIVLEKEYNDRKTRFAIKKKEQSKPKKTPKKSHKGSPKKSPRTPKKRSTDSPKATKSPKHRRTPKHKEERDFDKPWREQSVKSTTSLYIEVDSYPIYPNDYAVLEYLIPDDLCGKIIGKHGKAVKDINEKTGAYVCIETEKIDDRCILSISGLLSQAQEAEKVYLSKFKSSLQKYVANMPSDPKVESVCLECNKSVNVIVTAVVNAGNLSLQIFDSDVDSKLVKLQSDIHNSYSTPPQRVFYHDSRKPKMGELCISFIDNMWYRVQVQEYLDDSQVVVFFVDYGGNVVVPWQMLYKIRKELLDLPAQAIQCYMAKVFPTGQEDFSYSANLTCNQLVEGKVLRAYVHSVYEDVPCVELFYTNEETNLETSVNRNLVEWGLVSPFVVGTISGDVENGAVIQPPVETESVIEQ